MRLNWSCLDLWISGMSGIRQDQEHNVFFELQGHFKEGHDAFSVKLNLCYHWTLQQDNDAKHTSKKTKARFLECS